MQTFLPYSDFARSAEVLDRARLGKQRVETLQIMKALITNQGWIHHPATRMWEGYEPALFEYQEAVVNEWTSRGYQDTCLDKTANLMYGARYYMRSPTRMPPWLGRVEFHKSHQSNLLRKNPNHYSQFFQDVPNNLPYVWPRST